METVHSSLIPMSRLKVGKKMVLTLKKAAQNDNNIAMLCVG